MENNKKVNIQLLMFAIFFFLLLININMVLKPMFSYTMNCTYIGKIEHQFARLTLEKDGSCDYYVQAIGERFYGKYTSGIVARNDVAGVIVIHDIDSFSFNTIFSAKNMASGDTIYNITAISKQILLLVGYALCLYFGFLRGRKPRKKQNPLP